VSLLAFMNGYISEGTSRFITFAIGEKNEEHLKNTFSGALALHVMIACLILIAAETVGLWYVENKLNIQAGREDVAHISEYLSLSQFHLWLPLPFAHLPGLDGIVLRDIHRSA